MKPTHYAELALPHLCPSISLAYTIRGDDTLSPPLALAMLEAGIIVDLDFQPRSKRLVDVFATPDEHDLVQRALSRWWQEHNAPLKLFRWNLHVQALDNTGYGNPVGPAPWFCLTQNGLAPPIYLARQVKRLESELKGFGQTVLAVLYDAFRLLPEAYTPWKAYWMAQFYYWGGFDNENDYIEERMCYGDHASREDLLAQEEVVTRADFFGDMPEWVVSPTRKHSRAALERAARSRLAKDVIEACDRICTLVNAPGFQLQSNHVGVAEIEVDSIEGCVLMRWHADDSIGRAFDDGFEDLGNSGEYCDFISAQQVEPTPESIATYMRRMEDMLRLAAAVEPLLFLLNSPEPVEVPC